MIIKSFGIGKSFLIVSDQSDHQLDLKAEENYWEFLFRDEYKGKESGLQVLAKADVEVIAHARMYQEMGLQCEGYVAGSGKEIKESIKPVSTDGTSFE